MTTPASPAPGTPANPIRRNKQRKPKMSDHPTVETRSGRASAAPGSTSTARDSISRLRRCHSTDASACEPVREDELTQAGRASQPARISSTKRSSIMFHFSPVNPFYRAIRKPAVFVAANAGIMPLVYAKLPMAPRTASPVPHLTSLYHFSRAAEHEDRSYPGNCGGNLIKDLLLFFRPSSVFDRKRHMPRRLPRTRNPLRFH
jgi:hypothetical protein